MCRNLLDILLTVKFITNSKAAGKKQNKSHHCTFTDISPDFQTNDQKETVKQHRVIPQEKKHSRFSECAVMLRLQYDSFIISETLAHPSPR